MTRVTATDMIEKAGLDFGLELQPISVARESHSSADMMVNENAQDIHDYKAVVRVDRPGNITDDHMRTLGIVSPGYKVCAPTQALSVLDPLVDFGVTFDKAQSLYGGKIFLIEGTFEDSKTVLKANGFNDELLPRLRFWSHNDGNGSVQMRMEFLRLVCTNGLTITVGDPAYQVKIPHTGNLERKIKIAGGIVQSAVHQLTGAATQFEHMVNTPMSWDDFHKYGYVLWQNDPRESDEKSDTVMTKRQHEYFLDALDRFNHADGQSAIADTYWTAYNAMTGMIDHLATTKARTEEGAIKSNLMGPLAQFKSDALALAVAGSHSYELDYYSQDNPDARTSLIRTGNQILKDSFAHAALNHSSMN